MVSLASGHFVRTSRLRRWRSVLALFLSLALVLSASHCWCLDDDPGTLTVSVAAAGDTGETSPDAHAPHCDHCMAHVITVAPPAASAAVEYVNSMYRLAASPVPDAADPESPFKPPRA